jgi:hypothetical protein
MLPYMTQQPYASGTYLTDQAMIRGANYPFSLSNPSVSPWGGADVYTSSNVMIPPQCQHRGRLRGLIDWITTLDPVDGTLVMAGISMTVLFIVSMVVEAFRDAVRTWEANEKRKEGNSFQRSFRKNPPKIK